jgi:cyanophycinase
VVAGVSAPFARALEPVPPPTPEKSGILFIVGGGNMPDSFRKHFLELAGGADARIVVIPTASFMAEQPELLTTYSFFKEQKIKSVALLHTRDRKKADEADFIKPLLNATGVWMTGGDQSRISASYHGTAVEKELKSLLGRGGVIGGTSAGAAAMSSLMIVGGREVAEVGTGLGLLTEVVIDQHFQNRNRLQRLLGVLAKHPDCPGVGIDEETALIVEGGSAIVEGNGNVRACLGARGTLPPSVQVLKSGEKLDLDALIKAASIRGKPTGEAKATPRNPPAAPMDRSLLSKP